MKTIRLICECCGVEYEAVIPSTCSKSCAGVLREQSHKVNGTGKASTTNSWTDRGKINLGK